MIYTKYDSQREAVIYSITCNVTGKVYIGSSVDYENRKVSHITSTNNTCTSKEIIDGNDYIFNKLETFLVRYDCSKLLKEQWYLDTIPNINKIRAFRTPDPKKAKHNYYMKHKVHINAMNKVNYEKNKPERTIYKHNWYMKNIERLTISNKEYRDSHKVERALGNKLYKKNNKDKINKNNRLKVQCVACNKMISKGNVSHHNKTKVHLNNIV
jgi:hypothetical protein